MLKHCRISQYKIKKILKYFVEDYTSTETSKLTKLSRNTIDRYYSIFRKISKQIYADLVRDNYETYEYLGWVKQEYGPKRYTEVYKMGPTLFFPVFRDKRPLSTKVPYEDKEFQIFIPFAFKRFAKFRGFSNQSFYSQIYETLIRFYYPQKELYNIILSHLTKKSKENKLQ